MKKFIKNLFVFILIIVAVIGGINSLFIYRSINYGTMGIAKNDNAYIENVPEKIDICNFGSSHGYYGFNYENVSDEYVCYNFALPSQSLSYDYRILDSYRDNIVPGATVYICISYNSFFGEKETEDSKFESKNRRYYKFLEPSSIKEYDLKTLMFVKYFPSLIASPEEMIDTIILGKKPDDFWCDSTNSDEAKKHGNARYERHVKDRTDDEGKRIFNQEEIDAAIDLINLSYEIGATPVLVTTPYLSDYTEAVKENDPLFYDDFYGVINDIQNKTGVRYFDYQSDERFIGNYDLFFNTDHLNRAGAMKFTDILIEDTH